jgi:aspartyl-tRNA(Asn)/glutamyl-tRNA(Gln) amidotransferase subunit A
MKPLYNSLSEVQKDILSGAITLPELIRYYLEKIEKTRDLNIYLEIFAEEALQRATYLQKKMETTPNECGKLWGMVISIKDVICYTGHEISAGSKILQGFKSLYSATAVDRILAEDGIIIGRTNCDEFAMGSASENSYFGPVKNGLDKERVPGGSSGGSAVAVQVDTCLASLGSDTGGSVRQPAAFCGITGMKPSFGRISRHGLIAYGSSFDQIGIMAHSVSDTALLLEVISGPDDYDSTAISSPPLKYSALNPIRFPIKVAYYQPAIHHPRLDPETKQTFLSIVDWMRANGIEIEAIEFDDLDLLVPTYYVLTTAEASSNLSRYDGIRYGYRSPNASTLEETYKLSRTEGFGSEVKKRIILGTFVLSSGYYGDYFEKAQEVRKRIKQTTEKIFEEFDFIIMPTTPAPAWKIGEKTKDPIENYLADIFTVQANLAEIPAISLPMGKNSNNLPLGLQIMSGKFKEDELLRFADFMEKNLRVLFPFFF